MLSPRLTRIAILTVTGVLLVFAALEFVFLWRYIGAQNAIGTDHGFFVSIARRWLDTGEFYLPHQLAGPYVSQTNVDVLYPPIALLLFVPFVWIPFPFWWAIPAVVLGAVLWRLRPAMWTWPIMAALVAWPRFPSRLIYGNTDMWLLAAIAAGVIVGWTAVFVLIKPSLAVFALVGVRRRSWWLAAAFLAVVSLLMVELWSEYVTAMRNLAVDLTYSLVDVPPMLIPIVAWLGRTDRPHSWRVQLHRPWLIFSGETRGRTVG
jgi:hypothetical protein